MVLKGTPTPNSEIYTEDYYLKNVSGANEFNKKEIPKKFIFAYDIINPSRKDKMLDIGCGRGEIINSCKSVCPIIGIDYSLSSIKITKQYTTENLMILADARYLPFKEGSFTKITLFDVAEHINHEEFKECLKDIYRVLEPKGELIMDTPNGNRKYFILFRPLYRRIFWKGFEDVNEDKYHVNVMTPREIKNIFKEMNFPITYFWKGFCNINTNYSIYSKIILKFVGYIGGSMWIKAKKMK